MEFSPNNPIVKLCIQGMAQEEKGKPVEALTLFLQAWKDATGDFEKFLAAHFVARNQEKIPDRLAWLEKALRYALKVNDDSVKGAFPSLYKNIAECHKTLGDPENAEKNYELAEMSKSKPTDTGPFYHGTKADLQVGDMLTAGNKSNYRPDLNMNHVYFTALINGAGLAAGLAKGRGRERIYIVEPTGGFENDPNVTDKKFPGNPTRSYRTSAPVKIVGDVQDWAQQTPEELQKWREKLAKSKGDIID